MKYFSAGMIDNLLLYILGFKDSYFVLETCCYFWLAALSFNTNIVISKEVYQVI